MGCVREWVARRYRRVNTRAHRRGRQEEAGGGGRRRDVSTHWRHPLEVNASTYRKSDRPSKRERSRVREREKDGQVTSGNWQQSCRVSSTVVH